jgi:hypothetical protein
MLTLIHAEGSCIVTIYSIAQDLTDRRLCQVVLMAALLSTKRLCINSDDLWSRQCSGGSEDKCCAVFETMRVKVWFGGGKSRVSWRMAAARRSEMTCDSMSGGGCSHALSCRDEQLDQTHPSAQAAT